MCLQTANVSTSDMGDISLNPDLSFYQMIYGLTVVAMLVLSAIKGYSFIKVTLHASSKLHDTMFKKVREAGGHAKTTNKERKNSVL